MADSDNHGGDRELLAFVRGEIRHESGMLSSRLGAFLTSQSFLLIAYGTTMSGSLGQWRTPFTLLIPPALALLGLVLAAYAWVGVRAAAVVLAQWHARQDELMDGNPALEGYRPAVPGGRGAADAAGTERLRRQGTVFAKHTPPIFAAAWCYLGVLPPWFHANG